VKCNDTDKAIATITAAEAVKAERLHVSGGVRVGMQYGMTEMHGHNYSN
jgi:hypothetical protein